ncbi:pyruvate kinase [Candidatus Woesearchaeota archaeon]|nr:pyruvate kinase [Candidatus Woesearchaeota archaeon]
MRKTKIIATIGPKTDTKKAILELAEAGVSILRLNMSHGTREWHQSIIDKVNEINFPAPVAIMMDTTGPEIRTDSNGKEVSLEEGDIFKIAVSSACDIQEKEKHTHVNYSDMVNNVKKKDIILIDDGLIALEVLKIEPHHIICRVLNKGMLGDKKCVNLPKIRVNLPAVTEKDKKDLKLAIKNDVEFVAQSFVRGKQDVMDMRNILDNAKCRAKIIAKIEDAEGIKNIDEIIDAADGIMVARGDLGVELPFEEIPIVQRMIILKCREIGIPVIVATHLLESMVNNPRPTRAEVTDVANAVFERADCVMLTSETTKGDYPVQSVLTLSKIAKNIQKRFKSKIRYTDNDEKKDVKEIITRGACINAEGLNAKGILVFTKSGRLLEMVVKHRPNVDIFAFTDDKKLRKQLVINWGTASFQIDFKKDFESTVCGAIKILKQNKMIKKNDLVVVVSDVKPREDVDVMEIRKIS